MPWDSKRIVDIKEKKEAIKETDWVGKKIIWLKCWRQHAKINLK